LDRGHAVTTNTRPTPDQVVGIFSKADGELAKQAVEAAEAAFAT
jgi:hypothetical protein